MWSDSAKKFTHFIAESQRQEFLHSFSESPTAKFFSFLMDGSTDSGNLEVELVLVVFCVKDKMFSARLLQVIRSTSKTSLTLSS